MEGKLMESLTFQRNGNLKNRLPGSSSLTFPGYDAEALIVNMTDFAISTGSACNSGAIEPSHVLEAIGLSRGDAYSKIRIGLGRFSKKEEVEEFIERINHTLKNLMEK